MASYLLASSNAHKAQELSSLLSSCDIEVCHAPKKLDVVEDGSSFQENALKKAKEYFEEYERPVLSDDSGLVVKSLPDDLGIYSARFGGEGLSDKQRALLLLEKLDGISDRDAYFVCQLCFYMNPTEIYFFEGRVNGKISLEYRGEHGFGYDPVFIPEKLLEENKTLAQAPEWKDKYSHRSVACKKAISFFS